ncbi:MAG: hypothetical protein J1E85_00780 [Ruminococcus sp.]|nr:hypothetical protein [Ruminococcus sp.]
MLLWSQLKALKSMKLIDILNLLLSIAAGFFGTIWLVMILTNMAIPDENLIVWNSGVFSNFSFIAFCVEITLIAFALLKLIELGIIYLVKKIRNKADELKEKINKDIDFEDGWQKAVGLLIVIFVVFNALLCYFVLVDNTTFTETNIIKRSLINPIGTTYNYSDVLSYDVDDDGCNNAMFVLHMKKGGTIKVGYSDNMGGAGNNYEKTDFDYLVRIDEILQDLKVKKNIKCSPDDFAYYKEQKTNLDILMK